MQRRRSITTSKRNSNQKNKNIFESISNSIRNINYIRILKYISILSFVSILIYLIFIVVSTLTIKPLCSICNESSVLSNSRISDTTLIVIESPTENKILGSWVVSKNNENGDLLIYFIPWWVYIYDYSGTSLSSRVSLANLSYSSSLVVGDRAREYTLWQLIQNIGIPINNYIWIDSASIVNHTSIYGDIADFSKSDYSKYYDTEVSNDFLLLHSFISDYSLTQYIKDFNSHKQLINSVETNYSSIQLLNFIHKLQSNLKVTGIHSIDISQASYTSEIYDKELARNIPVINANTVDIKYIDILSKLKSRAYSAELSRAEVYNGSEISGLAFRYKRILSNSGVNVIRYDNSPEPFEKTTLYITNDKFPITKEIILNIFDENINIVYANPGFITTGDFVVVLGNDIANRIEWR